jgi:protease I
MFGFEVDTACPKKKKGDTIATAVHDFDGFQTYSEKRGHNFPITIDFDAVNEKEYDGLYVPGGRGPEYIRLFDRVLEIVRHFDSSKKPIASLCHGPQVLITAGILKGRKVTSYCAICPELQQAGAIFVDSDALVAVVDGNLVTGVDWTSEGAVCLEFVKLLGVTVHKQ